MVNIVFEVDKLAIAYIMQLRNIRDFGVSRCRWGNIFKGVRNGDDEFLVRSIEKNLEGEYAEAEELKKIVERKWLEKGCDILIWLRELTKIEFKEPEVRVCVVPFNAGQTPFKDIPLIVVGKIRGGWDYPETLAHELTHILFNQNFGIKDEFSHPYVQLIEEEIAVRLGARSGYFDYEVPEFACWVQKAKDELHAWKHYLEHIEDFEDVGEFMSVRIKNHQR